MCIKLELTAHKLTITRSISIGYRIGLILLSCSKEILPTDNVVTVHYGSERIRIGIFYITQWNKWCYPIRT